MLTVPHFHVIHVQLSEIPLHAFSAQLENVVQSVKLNVIIDNGEVHKHMFKAV